MVADVDAFSVFSGRTPLKSSGSFAVVHADPAAPDLPGLVADMGTEKVLAFWESMNAMLKEIPPRDSVAV